MTPIDKFPTMKTSFSLFVFILFFFGIGFGLGCYSGRTPEAASQASAPASNKVSDPVSKAPEVSGSSSGSGEVIAKKTTPTAPASPKVIELNERKFVESDPWAALALCEKMPAGMRRNGFYQFALRSLYKKSPQEAIDYLKAMPDGVDRVDAIHAVLNIMVGTDPDSAMELMEMVPPKTHDGLLQDFTRMWARVAPEQVQQWASEQTDEGVRAVVWPQLIESLTDNQPQAAADLAMGLPGAKERNESLFKAAYRWGRSDPQAAADYFSSLPEGKDRETTFVGISRVWHDQDPRRQSEWVESLPAGGTKDAVLANQVLLSFRSNPAEAIGWAMKVGARDRRSRPALERMATQWMKSDAAAARAWLEKSPLPETTRQKILSEQKK